MIDKKKLIIIATLIIVGVFGVAMYLGGKVKTLSLEGATNFDTVQVSDEVAFTTASSTNIRTEQATSSPAMSVKRLYIGPGLRMDSWYNDTGYSVDVAIAMSGFNSGTASSSIRMSLFATTTGPSKIKSLYSYTTLTEAINGSNTFLMRNFIYATSTTATTTNNQQMLKQGSGSGVVTVPNAGYLHLFVQQGDLLNCATSSCETSTSSARGIGDYFARFVYFRDIY